MVVDEAGGREVTKRPSVMGAMSIDDLMGSVPAPEPEPMPGVCLKMSNRISATSAMARLLAGPASVVRMSSRLTFLKLRRVTGQGLAQPMSAPTKKRLRAGITIEPQGSMCLAGLRVTRPSM